MLVVSPGLSPLAPIIAAAQSAGVPVWGELELAWRLRLPSRAAPWLVITGTNGKTTTTLMLAAMLRAAGLRTVAAGNIGVSMVDVVMAEATPEGQLDVIAVEVGAPQLPFLHSMSPQASVCLNIAEDHVDLFGSFDAYVAAKARIYSRTQVAAVYNVADEVTLRMVRGRRRHRGLPGDRVHLGDPGPQHARRGRGHPRRSGLRGQPGAGRPGAGHGRRRASGCPPQRGQCTGGRGAGPGPRGPGRRGARRAAGLRAGGTPDLPTWARSTASATSTTPRRPTAMRRRPP